MLWLADNSASAGTSGNRHFLSRPGKWLCSTDVNIVSGDFPWSPPGAVSPRDIFLPIISSEDKGKPSLLSRSRFIQTVLHVNTWSIPLRAFLLSSSERPLPFIGCPIWTTDNKVNWASPGDDLRGIIVMQLPAGEKPFSASSFFSNLSPWLSTLLSDNKFGINALLLFFFTAPLVFSLLLLQKDAHQLESRTRSNRSSLISEIALFPEIPFPLKKSLTKAHFPPREYLGIRKNWNDSEAVISPKSAHAHLPLSRKSTKLSCRWG